MRRFLIGTLLAGVLLVAAGPASTALAQDATPTTTPPPNLQFYTNYPSQEVGIGNTLNMTFTALLQSADPQQVDLSVENLPDGWTASFSAQGHMIQSVYVHADTASDVTLKVTPPDTVTAGTYNFNVHAQGNGLQSDFPVEVIVLEKVPSNMTMTVDLDTVRGSPTTNFHYSVQLKNEGGDDLSVDLSSTPPQDFSVTFKLAGQEVTNIPLPAGSTKNLDVSLTSLITDEPAGQYPFTIMAQAGDLSASLDLTAEVVGTPRLSLSTPDQRLSGDAEAGKDATYTLALTNDGSAPQYNITMSSTPPTGWDVTFSPSTIDQLDPGAEQDVTVTMHPSDKALAGDYVVTMKAQPQQGTSQSVDFRVTVRTSTLWGIVGVALIAVAVAVVGIVVTRFGRR